MVLDTERAIEVGETKEPVVANFSKKAIARPPPIQTNLKSEDKQQAKEESKDPSGGGPKDMEGAAGTPGRTLLDTTQLLLATVISLGVQVRMSERRIAANQ